MLAVPKWPHSFQSFGFLFLRQSSFMSFQTKEDAKTVRPVSFPLSERAFFLSGRLESRTIEKTRNQKKTKPMIQDSPCENCRADCLNSVSFLSGLSPEQKTALSSHLYCLRCQKGSYLFHEGDRADSLIVLRHGRVKLSSVDGEGREKIIGIFAEGDALWESLFLGNSTYPYSAVAVSTTDYCQIAKADFENAISDTPTALRIIALLSKKLHDANERNLILATADPSRRIAKFFLYRLERSHDSVLELRLEDIAASVSLRPETVSRKLAELIDEGFLRKQGQSGYAVLDIDALKELAES